MKRLACVVPILLLSACGGDGSNGSGDSVASYLDAICPWESACNQQLLQSCYRALAEDDPIAGFVTNFRANGMDDAIACARDATSCDEYAACPTQASVYGGNSSAYTCPGDREVVCDESTDILLWCIGAAAGESPGFSADLTLEGQSCGPGDSVGDEPQQACTTEACDGSARTLCVDNRTMTSDCANWHPDYQCTADMRCEVLNAECESNNLTNSGGSARCTNASTASVCMKGKLFEVSCAAVGATCVEVDEHEARCELM